jgi:hypothetical protein
MRKTANVPPPALYVEFLRLIIVRKPKFNILYAGWKNIDYPIRCVGPSLRPLFCERR